MKFPGSIKVRVTTEGLPVWYATALMVKATPEKTVGYLNCVAARKGIDAHYELATQAEYDAYKAEQRAAIAQAV